jgi:hypothetical protein
MMWSRTRTPRIFGGFGEAVLQLEVGGAGLNVAVGVVVDEDEMRGGL